MKGDKKHTVMRPETDQKTIGISMNQFPVILKSSIEKWGERMRETTGDKFFCEYEELSNLIELAPSTLYSYTNKHNPVYPTVQKLVLICTTIKDKTPLDFLQAYSEALFR